ncbi:MAG: hypothetical protein M0C28_03105 [Candidatus Moduliflexus flocculans]|nr:hypothetical protein [Candidatus Moduliflexus flocculans]
MPSMSINPRPRPGRSVQPKPASAAAGRGRRQGRQRAGQGQEQDEHRPGSRGRTARSSPRRPLPGGGNGAPVASRVSARTSSR